MPAAGHQRRRGRAAGRDRAHHAGRAASKVSCHRARNVLAKVPKNAQADVKADYWAIFDVPEAVEPGPDAVAFVQARIDAFVRRWRDSYPAAVRCLLADRDSLTVYLRFPPRAPGQAAALQLHLG
jgi:transposase-like protein